MNTKKHQRAPSEHQASTNVGVRSRAVARLKQNPGSCSSTTWHHPNRDATTTQPTQRRRTRSTTSRTRKAVVRRTTKPKPKEIDNRSRRSRRSQLNLARPVLTKDRERSGGANQAASQVFFESCQSEKGRQSVQGPQRWGKPSSSWTTTSTSSRASCCIAMS